MKASAYENYRERSIVGEQTNWKGFWLTSHRFYHPIEYRRYGYNRIPQFNSEIQNIHTLFRKQFTLLDKKIQSAKLFITGDDLYKLYINGKFVGEGPAQSYPFAYPYNCFDVTDLLQSGENAIGVHLYYQGLFNIYLMSADNLCGLIAQLEIAFCDGSIQTIHSDQTWKYQECDAYSHSFIQGYDTQFSENIDFNAFEKDWFLPNFNDTAWKNALVAANPCPMEYNLIPQITPTASHEIIYPTNIKNIENGYLFDFSKEIVGSPAFLIQGKKGQKIEIRHGEELDENGRVRFQLRANCTYQEWITLTGEQDFVKFFDYKGFRYIEILNTSESFDPSAVFAVSRHYPFPCQEKTAKFSCNDENMNKIWEICARAVKIGTQDTYYDCPTREKGGFLGDALITGLSHLILTGDTRIYKKFILDLFHSARYSPALACHVPSYNINFCADYSALAPLFLDIYYQYTGDKLFLKQTLSLINGVWEYYSQFLENGLLRRIRHMPKVDKNLDPLLVDWPQNFRDNYDLTSASQNASTLHNLYFYGFLKTAEKLNRIVENEARADEWKALYQVMEESLIKECYDATTGLFRDAPQSKHISLHANVLPLFFEMQLPKGYAPIKDFIMQKRLSCGVYFAFFLLQGLFNAGYPNEAIELLNSKDENSWFSMLESGATACLEVWKPNQKWNTSFCHPWASSPIYFYACKVMGVTYNASPIPKIKIQPHIPCHLENIQFQIPLPCGIISARFTKENEETIYTLTAPKTVKVEWKGENIRFVLKQEE